MTHSDGQEELSELLDALRAEYTDSSAGDVLPPEELDACDAATRQAVVWLRDAWALESGDAADSRGALPTLAVARSAARFQSHVGRRRRVAALLSMAAAIALSSTMLWRALESEASPAVDTPVATGTPPLAREDDPKAAPPPAQLRRDFGPESFRSRDDGVEIISGSVRLVLLHRTD